MSPIRFEPKTTPAPDDTPKRAKREPDAPAAATPPEGSDENSGFALTPGEPEKPAKKPRRKSAS